jgi:hypothetical protein
VLRISAGEYSGPDKCLWSHYLKFKRQVGNLQKVLVSGNQDPGLCGITPFKDHAKAETRVPVSIITLALLFVGLSPYRLNCILDVIHSQLCLLKRFRCDFEGSIKPVLGRQNRKNVVIRIDLFSRTRRRNEYLLLI